MNNSRNSFARIVAGAIFALVCLAQTQAQAALLNAAGQSLLETKLGEGSLSLTNVYTKTSGDTSFNWHAAADNIGRTFTLMEVTGATLANGSGTFAGPMIIGGYNPLSWDSSGNYNAPFIRDAFLFNLTQGTFLDQSLAGPGYYQTYNESFFGPIFGGGYDIFVYHDMNSGDIFPYSYDADGLDPIVSLNILGTLGYWNFTVGSVETYTIANVSAPALSAVPLPPSAILFGTALLGLAGIRRRKRKAA